MKKDLAKVVKDLKERFKKGHPRFVDITIDELDLHDRKNYDYTQGGDPLGNFNRVSNILSNYPNLDNSPKVVALIYALKQVDATLWMWNQGYEGEIEGVQERLRDIHVYIKLIRILVEEENGRAQNPRK